MFKKVHHLTRGASACVLAVLAVATVPASSSADSAVRQVQACTPNATTQVFAAFGDPRYYYLAPGGAFEGSISWRMSGAVSLAAENEPWYLAGTRHQSSARLAAGASITSEKFCVSRDTPYLRFLAKSAGSGQLDVTIRV